MMDSVTTDDLDDYRILVIALTGPPAAGKSTIANMIADHGVPVRDTGEYVRDRTHDRLDDTPVDQITEDDYWETATMLREEHGDSAPTSALGDWIGEERARGSELICLSSLRDQAEVDWLREHVGPTLVVRVDADDYARSERYVKMNLEPDEDRGSVARERVESLREELYEREYREMPYPDHDVSIRNEDSVQIIDIYRRLEHLIEICRA